MSNSSSAYTKIITKKEFADRYDAGRWDNNVPYPYLVKSTRGNQYRPGLPEEDHPYPLVDVINSDRETQFAVYCARQESVTKAQRAIRRVKDRRADLQDIGLPCGTVVNLDSELNEIIAQVADAAVVLELAYVVLDV